MTPLNSKPFGGHGSNAQIQAFIMTVNRLDGEESFRAFVIKTIFKKRKANNESALVTLLRSKQLLIEDDAADFLKYVKDSVSDLVLKTPAYCQRDVDNRLMAASETLIFQAVNKAVNPSKYVDLLLNARN